MPSTVFEPKHEGKNTLFFKGEQKTLFLTIGLNTVPLSMCQPGMNKMVKALSEQVVKADANDLDDPEVVLAGDLSRNYAHEFTTAGVFYS